MADDQFVPIVYVGPFDSVTLAETGLEARPGEPVEVVPSLARRLLEQPDNWTLAPGAAPLAPLVPELEPTPQDGDALAEED